MHLFDSHLSCCALSIVSDLSSSDKLLLFPCPEQCSFVEHRSYKIIYRRYASLFFLVGVDSDEVGIFITSPSLRCVPNGISQTRLLKNIYDNNVLNSFSQSPVMEKMSTVIPSRLTCIHAYRLHLQLNELPCMQDADTC